MGMFDKFKSSTSDTALTLQEATSGILLAVVGSDGHIADEEVAFFNLVANRHPIFRDQPGTDFRRMIDKMIGLLNREGWSALITRCGAAVPSDAKPTVFALAVDFVFADGSVEQAEKEVVAHLQSQLGIADDLAGAVVDVLAAKNGIGI
jgi:hypothetical protein